MHLKCAAWSFEVAWLRPASAAVGWGVTCTDGTVTFLDCLLRRAKTLYMLCCDADSVCAVIYCSHKLQDASLRSLLVRLIGVAAAINAPCLYEVLGHKNAEANVISESRCGRNFGRHTSLARTSEGMTP